MRSISSYRRRGRLCCCAPGIGTKLYTYRRVSTASLRARVDKDSPDLVVHRWWEEGLEHPEEDDHMMACAVVDNLPIVREVVAAEAYSRGVVGSLDACPDLAGMESREDRSGLLGKLKDLWAHLC